MNVGQDNKKGFTLLEVLIALTIIGISLGVVFQSLARSKRISWKADDLMEAARISQNLMSDPKFLAQVAKDGEIEGSVEGEDEKWTYALIADPLELEVGEDEEATEVTGMHRLKFCLNLGGVKEKSFCMERWIRE